MNYFKIIFWIFIVLFLSNLISNFGNAGIIVLAGTIYFILRKKLKRNNLPSYRDQDHFSLNSKSQSQNELIQWTFLLNLLEMGRKYSQEDQKALKPTYLCKDHKLSVELFLGKTNIPIDEISVSNNTPIYNLLKSNVNDYMYCMSSLIRVIDLLLSQKLKSLTNVDYSDKDVVYKLEKLNQIIHKLYNLDFFRQKTEMLKDLNSGADHVGNDELKFLIDLYFSIKTFSNKNLNTKQESFTEHKTGISAFPTIDYITLMSKIIESQQSSNRLERSIIPFRKLTNPVSEDAQEILNATLTNQLRQSHELIEKKFQLDNNINSAISLNNCLIAETKKVSGIIGNIQNETSPNQQSMKKFLFYFGLFIIGIGIIFLSQLGLSSVSSVKLSQIILEYGVAFLIFGFIPFGISYKY